MRIGVGLRKERGWGGVAGGFVGGLKRILREAARKLEGGSDQWGWTER